MYRYRGQQNGMFKVEDTSDGVIDLLSGDDLRIGLIELQKDGQDIDGVWIDDDGNICDNFGTVLVAAPVIKRNSNLSKAKKAKNDEFYTQLSDIEKELSNYPLDAFKDKVIYLPMDVAVNTGATMQSQFVKYFQLNAHRLQFKKLIATCLVERAAADGESLEQVQNCYVLERVTVPTTQRNIWGHTHGFGVGNPVVGEVDDFGIKYNTKNGITHPVPYHIVNQAVTDANGRIVLVKKYINHYDEVDGHVVLGDEFIGKTWSWSGHQLKIKWCRLHPTGELEILPDECYFFNNDDIFSDFGIFPKDKDGNPCFEDVPGGSVCLLPAEYYDYQESEYIEYSRHCPEDAGEHGGSGDFRSEYCRNLLDECDIVVTNPPFSLFREWWNLLIHSGKQFIFIGNINCVTYKEVFPYIKSGELKVGFNKPGGTRKGNSMYYWSPADDKLKDVQSWWFHNIPGIKETGKHDKSEYMPMQVWLDKGVEYPKYDNYDAIDVSAEQKIPIDYDGVMGVPITALRYLDLSLFEIVAFRKGDDGKDLVFTNEREREFNRTFGFLFDGADGSNYRSSLDEVFRRKEQICQDSDSSEDMKFFAEYICSHLDLAEQAVLKRESSRGVVQVEHRPSGCSEECRGQDSWEDYLCETVDSEELTVFFPLSNPSRAAGTMNGFISGKETYRRILIRHVI